MIRFSGRLSRGEGGRGGAKQAVVYYGRGNIREPPNMTYHIPVYAQQRRLVDAGITHTSTALRLGMVAGIRLWHSYSVSLACGGGIAIQQDVLVGVHVLRHAMVIWPALPRRVACCGAIEPLRTT